jgi:hypothetical protein
MTSEDYSKRLLARAERQGWPRRLRDAGLTRATAAGRRGAGQAQGARRDDKVTVAQKQEALFILKTTAVYRSNQDKRRDVEAALRANPARRNREIAAMTGTNHPFVAKTRRKMETVIASERG